MSLSVIILTVLCLTLFAGLAIAVAVVWMQNRQEERANPMPEPAEYAPARAASEQAQRQVRALLAEGKKLEAIKVYRTDTGASLKEAMDAVEAIERGMA